jgi:hypothetical protein
MSLRTTFLKAIAMFALILAPALAAPPEGKIEINYHRCDGKFEKWGAHLWKSPNMPLPDIEWPNPMMPTGKTDFGVYWWADLSEFNTGSKAQVNYIIHKGDIKEQGGKDKAFDGNAHKAIWVITGDSTIYFSKEEALKDHVCKK